MTWFRVDDGLPEHRKSIALWKACKSDWKVYAVACWAWRDMGCDCAHWNTHGVFERDRAHRVLRAPEKIVDSALDALVAAGFLSSEGDTFTFHDWQEYQPTKEEIAARKAAISAVRSVAGKKGGQRSGQARAKQQPVNGEANGKQTEANGKQTEATPEQEGSPVSRIPYPVGETTPTPFVAEAKQPAVEPEVAAEPPLVVQTYDPERMVGVMAAASNGKFDAIAGSLEHLADLYRRFRKYEINEAVAVAMGHLLRAPRMVWPWATRIDAEFVRIEWLVGKATSSGSFDGSNLGELVAKARKAVATAEAKRVAAAAAPQAPVVQKPAPISDDAKAAALANARAKSIANKSATDAGAL
jgi:hypothetical protein